MTRSKIVLGILGGLALFLCGALTGTFATKIIMEHSHISVEECSDMAEVVCVLCARGMTQ